MAKSTPEALLTQSVVIYCYSIFKGGENIYYRSNLTQLKPAYLGVAKCTRSSMPQWRATASPIRSAGSKATLWNPPRVSMAKERKAIPWSLVWAAPCTLRLNAFSEAPPDSAFQHLIGQESGGPETVTSRALSLQLTQRRIRMSPGRAATPLIEARAAMAAA